MVELYCALVKSNAIVKNPRSQLSIYGIDWISDWLICMRLTLIWKRVWWFGNVRSLSSLSPSINSAIYILIHWPQYFCCAIDFSLNRYFEPCTCPTQWHNLCVCVRLVLGNIVWSSHEIFASYFATYFLVKWPKCPTIKWTSNIISTLSAEFVWNFYACPIFRWSTTTVAFILTCLFCVFVISDSSIGIDTTEIGISIIITKWFIIDIGVRWCGWWQRVLWTTGNCTNIAWLKRPGRLPSTSEFPN